MKANLKQNTAVLALAALMTLAAAPAVARAAECYYPQPVAYCAPYVVSTQEVCRHTECRIAYDHCGRGYRYHVTTITYVNIYNTGARETFFRTYTA